MQYIGDYSAVESEPPPLTDRSRHLRNDVRDGSGWLSDNAKGAKLASKLSNTYEGRIVYSRGSPVPSALGCCDDAPARAPKRY